MRASDRGTPSRQNEVPVTIYILPSNEEVPIFENSENTFFLSETSDIGNKENYSTFLFFKMQLTTFFSSLGSVITTQKVFQDITIKYSLIGESSNMFDIDSQGQITLNSLLDRETLSVHRLAVIYETTSKPSLKSMRQVTLNVLDVNDNKPIFQSSRYEITLPEDIPIGTSILKGKLFK